MLYGGAGHGKSALASYFATNHEADFPDGLVGLKIAEEEERKSPEDIARNLATKYFGWKESELEGKNAASIMRDLFAERQMLLILDNADRGDDLRKLLPVGETCSIIITTRNTQLSSSLDLPAENGLEITTFKGGTDSGKDSSLKLLTTIIGAKLVEAEPEAAQKIARLVDYLPLALKIVAVSIKNARTRDNHSHFSLEEYGKKLENDKTILTELQVSGDKDLNLEASLNFTWKILDLDQRQKERIKNFFACLGVCAAEGFSENTAIATGKYDDDWDEDNLAATLYLKKLCDYSLLNQLGDGRYLFHPLVRVYARTLANQLSLRQAAEKRHANYIIQLVKSMDFSHGFLGYDNEEEIDEAEQLQQALLQDLGVTDWKEELVLVEEFDAAKEINDIVVAAKWLGTKEKIDYEFADKLNLFFEEYGYWEEANTVISKFYALAIKQQDWERVIIFGTRQAKFLSLQGELANAEKILDHVTLILKKIPLQQDISERCQVKWLVRRGSLRQQQGQFEQALQDLNKSVELAEELGDKELLRNSLNSLGMVLVKQNKLDDGVTIFKRVLEINQSFNHQREIAITLNRLGRVLQKQGKLDEAKDTFKKKLGIAKAFNDQYSEAIALNYLGGILLEQRKLNKAKDIFQQRLEISEALKDQHSIAIALNGLGGVLLEQGKLHKAKDTFQQELKIAKVLNDQRQMAIALNGLGRVLKKQGKLDEAKDTFQQELKIAKTLNDPKSVIISLNGLAGVLLKQGKLDEAKDAFQQELKIAKALNDQKSEAIALNGLGTVLQQQGKLHEALKIFEEEIEIAQILNNKQLLARSVNSFTVALNSLGGVLQQQGKLNEALKTFQEKIEIAQALNDQKSEMIGLNGLGGVLLEQGKLDEANNAFLQEIKIAQAFNDQKQIAIALNGLGKVLQEQGKLDEAKNAFQEELKICQTLNDQKQIAITLNGLGGVLLQLHQLDRAKDIFQQQLEIAQTLNDQRQMAIAFNGLGRVLQKQGKFSEALQAFLHVTEFPKELEVYSSSLIGRLRHLGGLLQKAGQFNEALEAAKAVIKISEAVNDSYSKIIGFNRLGGILKQQKKLDKAFEAFQQAFTMAEQLNDQKSVAIALNGWGKVLQQQEKWQEAIEKFEQELAIGEPYYKPNQLVAKWMNLGELLHSQGELSKALEAFFHAAKFSQQQGKLDKAQAILLRSKDIYEEHQLNHCQILADTFHLLGQVFQQKGQWEEAERYLLQSYSLQEKLPNLLQQARISNTIGQLYREKQDKFPSALMYLAEAFAIYEELKNVNGLKTVTTTLTYLLAKQNRWEEAAQYCARVLALEPETEEILKLQDLIANKSIPQQGRIKSLIKLKRRVTRDN